MSAKLNEKVQEVVDRMARNDPTMTEADLYGECAAADGAAAVALLHMQEARVRGVDCVYVTEPPCSSGYRVGDAGAASLAQALKKNTTLQTLLLICEGFVLCCDCGGVLIVFLCCWVVFFGGRGVCVVLIVCAPLKRRVHQGTMWARRGLHCWRKLWRRTRPCRRCTLTVSLLCCDCGGVFIVVLCCCGLLLGCVLG
jgi:hypothetical protein